MFGVVGGLHETAFITGRRSMLYCVLSGSVGTGKGGGVRHCEFYLIPQDNVSNLISKMLPRERLHVKPCVILLSHPKHVRQT